MQAMPVSVRTVRSRAQQAVMAVAVTATVPLETLAVCRTPSARLEQDRQDAVHVGFKGQMEG